MKPELFLNHKHVSNFFPVQGKMPYCLPSNVVSKLSCGRCNATYYGEICKHLSVRVGEHSDVSVLTEKNYKSKKSTTVKDLILVCDHVVLIEDFKILTTMYSDCHVKVKVSLFISRDIT